jgi:osmotically-inducible protein OsmY
MGGTRAVQNFEFDSPFGRRDPDDEIAKRALSLLRWKIRYDSILVQAEKGHVTLSGEVSWHSDRESAEHMVRKLGGVVSVTNLIVISRHPASQKRIKDALTESRGGQAAVAFGTEYSA